MQAQKNSRRSAGHSATTATDVNKPGLKVFFQKTRTVLGGVSYWVIEVLMLKRLV